MSGPVSRVARIGLNSVDPDGLARFFVDALGFARTGPTTLRLGDVPVDLHGVDGPAYPAYVAGWSPLFQHCALVVPDMAVALRRLATSTTWRPISIEGPETLPNGIVAFKFRDPEGHPLEFLALPDASQPRIDHSAISVADVARSIAFYGELGFRLGPRTLNRGIEQRRLDDVMNAEVDVVALLPAGVEKPHVELLGYRGAYDRPASPMPVDAIAATRLVLAFTSDDARDVVVARQADRIVRVGPTTLLRDPDGHLLELVVESHPTL